tara:strand:- start:1082 stop:1429 length:348 start_codon:yes stop_codon:yes gene_type:complete
MATVKRIVLSGMTASAPIATQTTSTTYHTVTTTTADYEEIWLWASNIHTAALVLTIEWTAAATSKEMHVTIQPDETVLVVPGWTIKGAASMTVKGKTTVADKINVVGHVNWFDDA